MMPEQHRQKAERIERSLAKCSAEDFEAVIEGAMLAGTHWLNAALHAIGFTAPDRDVLHAQYLAGNDRLKLSLLRPDLLAAIDAIECARARFVRGDMPGGRDAARQCREQLAVLRRAGA